ncbi:S-adenosyl-L-methionine-dependent methyltransferase [Sphaerosporella brunnea]|uniref:S-adenosyl-L-methionine-dependent methyltransferase n=1 Tax=Sphaerosporella brunnea TaxID=1250544 RepID=A0A5J5EL43_9PEZI|nr:S-adenosyl-L-methionine-dependent methyltransferase [Sphaerosporella brunnea]
MAQEQRIEVDPQVKEQDRLDLHHEIFLHILDGELHKAALDRPQCILDIGTDTGIWAVDMGDKYPMAEVLGTDLISIQPTWVPPNCQFELVLEGSPFNKDSLDFIRLAQDISGWPKVMSEAYRCTKPEGWCIAMTGLWRKTTPSPYFHEALAKIGRPFPLAATLVGHPEKACLKHVNVISYRHPYGPWPRDKRLNQIGTMAMLQAETGIGAYGMAAYTRILGIEVETTQKISRRHEEAGSAYVQRFKPDSGPRYGNCVLVF